MLKNLRMTLEATCNTRRDNLSTNSNAKAFNATTLALISVVEHYNLLLCTQGRFCTNFFYHFSTKKLTLASLNLHVEHDDTFGTFSPFLQVIRSIKILNFLHKSYTPWKQSVQLIEESKKQINNKKNKYGAYNLI